MSRRTRLAGAAASVALFSLLLSACGPSGGDASDGPSSITVAVASEPASFDAHTVTAQSAVNLLSQVYEPLVRFDNDLQLVPALAESWERTSDNSWEFKLRQGVTFSNGEPFDADAVIYNYERFSDPDVPTTPGTWFAATESMTAIDEFTLEVRTVLPEPTFLAAFVQFYIMAPGFLEDESLETIANGAPGTGPYLLDEWVRDDHVNFVRNPDYWNADAFDIDEVVFRTIPEGSTRTAGLMTGEIDLVDALPPADLVQLTEGSGAHSAVLPSTRAIYLAFNTTMEPFTDPRVRVALNYAIDKEALIEFVLGGNGKALDGQAITPEYFGYNPDLEAYPYDPDKARAILKQAGYDNDLTFDFISTNGQYMLDAELAEAIVGQLAEVGVTANLSLIETSAYLEIHGKRELGPAFILGFAHPTLAADGLLGFFHSKFRAKFYWQNLDFDADLDAARATLDDDERLDLFADATQIMYDEAPVVFLHQQYSLYGVADRLDWTARADQVLWFEGASVTDD